ncbi:hypothetical protein Nepgr_026344 [Nepenthes gracilis]|uniref:Autophagy-related protein 13 N-terminal domain-containing protein n=1 Tax=Nepenthes gracilis TaxID=150966 RepID=A0AAD3T9H4_NEPGR|nr:hypothetical protein Nepgr_026344 [Nepenthes gracilis]
MTMALSHGNVHSDTAKKEQIITEFFAKSLHIILESRSPFVSSRNYSGEQLASSPSSSSSSSSSCRPRDKWFNLALQECPAALENIDFWRQSNLEPMVVDVILIQQPINSELTYFSSKRDLFKHPSLKERPPNYLNLEQEDFGLEKRNEKVIERWVVQYESQKSKGNSSGSKRSSGNLHTLYKKSILLLRSLYVTVRLLPAYKLFRDLISSGQIKTYTLAHRLNSFAEPFTRREEADIQRFGFTPVDSSCGRLCVSVSYFNLLSDVGSETSTPISPHFILDYVGSPLADPLKSFPSLPVSQSSPLYSPFLRRHSWSFDAYRASLPSKFPSPSPTYSDSHASISKSRSQHPSPMSLPHHLPETFQAVTKNRGFDEYWPSPAFSPSTSLSPPTYIPSSDPCKALLRSESAPLSVPPAKPLNTLGFTKKQCLPPSPPIKTTRPGSVKTDKNAGTSSSAAEKFSLGRDESGRLSGVRISSNSSPRISISGSSSRLSIQDDFDDSEFACPFVVDEDDMIDRGGRPESFDQKSHQNESFEAGGLAPVRKSPDAAVGALVLMLNKAPPLRQDFTGSIASKTECSSNTIQASSLTAEGPRTTSSITSSGLLMSKTTSDALEELRGYREMKDLLLKQGSRSHMLDRSAADD